MSTGKRQIFSGCNSHAPAPHSCSSGAAPSSRCRASIAGRPGPEAALADNRQPQVSRFLPPTWHTAAIRKRVQIALAVLLVIFAGVIAWQVLHAQEHEPVYQGKRLSVWLERYDEGNYIAVTQQLWKKETDEAVRQIGTNAVPVLLRRIRAKDSPFTLWLMALTQKQHVIKIKFTPAYIRHREGMDGIEALGADARRAAVPALLGCLNDDDREVRSCAGLALKAIDPEAAAKAGVE